MGGEISVEMVEFPTFKGSWPWPWPWIGSYSTAYHHASLNDLYLHTKFHGDRKKTFSRITTVVTANFKVTWHKNLNKIKNPAPKSF